MVYYFQFFHEVEEVEYWMNTALSRIHLTFDKSGLKGEASDVMIIQDEMKVGQTLFSKNLIPNGKGKFEDTEEISRSRKYKKDGQCIGQEKDVKRPNNDLQNNLQNTKYWASRITQKHGC